MTLTTSLFRFRFPVRPFESRLTGRCPARSRASAFGSPAVADASIAPGIAPCWSGSMDMKCAEVPTPMGNAAGNIA